MFEQIKTSTLLDSDVLSISSTWCLRNDGEHLLFYKSTPNEAISWPLPPKIAIFCTLLGERISFGKLIEEVALIYNLKSRSEALQFIQSTIENLNEKESIVVINASPDRCLSFDPFKYFIPLDKYHLPQDRRLKRPTNIRFATGFSCQTDCLYCYAERKVSSSENRLSLERWRELVDEAVKNEIFNIDVTGADPFADAITPKVTAHILRANIPVFLSTKAAIEPDILDELIESGLNVVWPMGSSTLQVSIDSTIPEIADTLTGVKGYLKRADANVKLCLNKGVRVRVKSVLTTKNHDTIMPILQKYYALGVRLFHFVQCGYSLFRDTNELFLSPTQKDDINTIDELLNRDEFPGAEILIQTEKGYGNTKLTPEEWKKRSRCSGGYSSMTVCPDGNVILCEQLPESDAYFVGNVKNNSLMDVWNSERLKKWLQPSVEAFDGTPCFSCADFKECVLNAGWCYRDALFAYGKIHTAPPKCPKQLTPGNRLL